MIELNQRLHGLRRTQTREQRRIYEYDRKTLRGLEAQRRLLHAGPRLIRVARKVLDRAVGKL
jgi:hypothetical protein